MREQIMGRFVGDKGPFELFAIGKTSSLAAPRWRLELGPVDRGVSVDKSGVLWKTRGITTTLFALDHARGKLRWERPFESTCPTLPVRIRGRVAEFC